MIAVIEMFSVFQGTILVSGYAESGPPTLYYEGAALSVLHLPVSRPDLMVSHGPDAQHWGFRLCALPSMPRIDHLALSARFPDGTLLQNGVFTLATPGDTNYWNMVKRFRDATESGGRLLEIGSRARSGNIYRSLFSDKVSYTGLDITAGPNVDVVEDAHHLSRSVDGLFDYMLSISVFEHLLMPWKVALEMSKVMRVGGMGFIQSHAAFPLHEEPWDFWRYSKDAWRGIFNAHTGFKVDETAQTGVAWTVPAFASGGAGQDMDRHPNYLISACLVRKVSDPQVQWNAEVSDVYDLAYDHA